MSTEITREKVAVRDLVEKLGLQPDTDVIDAMPMLSTRHHNALRKGRVVTLADLASRDDQGLLDIRMFGTGMLDGLKRELEILAKATPSADHAAERECSGEMVDGRWYVCGYDDCGTCETYTDGAQ